MPRFSEEIRCLALLGPTCSRKTELALSIASQLGAEIISCDSMQVYRGLDIGTAKPAPDQRDQVPHHLIDVADIRERYDANRFVQEARAVLADLHSRQRLGLLVGGTGLYAKCLLYGRQLPPVNADISRAILEQGATAAGRRALLAELLSTEATVPKHLLDNPRRVARMVEQFRITGRVFPLRDQCFRTCSAPGFVQILLYPPPVEHRALIRDRIAAMLDAGWIEEVRRLSKAGLFESPTARQALGYRTVFRAISATPRWSRETLEQRLFAQTWAYVRRQRTWFRHQHPGAIHLPLRPALSMSSLASAIVSLLPR